MEVLVIFWGFDFCPHSVIPVTWNPEEPPWDATVIDTMCAIKMGTIYIPLHQLPTAVVNDTADLLIEHRTFDARGKLSDGAGAFNSAGNSSRVYDT